MNLDQILLLGSIIVPAFASILLFTGIGGSDSFAKKLAYIGFGFPLSRGLYFFYILMKRKVVIALKFFIHGWDYKNSKSLSI